MNLIDPQGHRVSNATPQSLDAYERAARELLCMVGDPLARIEQALALSPEMTMAHALKAWLMLLGTEAPALPAARAALDAAAGLPADDREQRHLAAARALCDGHWREAALRLEDLSLRYPRDTLALQVGHQLDFFRGDSRMLRDRIARALPAWDAGVPGWHAVLGMHAFGLEECGQYVDAERQGRRSVELEPHDSWGWHAVAHVHEMRHDPRAGIAWLQTTSDTWADGSFLATHNWWHLALFHLGSTTMPRCCACTTARSAAPARPWCSTSSTPARCCGACSCAGSTWAAAGSRSPNAGCRMRRAPTTPSTTCTRCSPSPAPA
ncbi:hypothetical protein LRS03_22040 [Rhizobacter sp. J219]|uniref:hypothetical protein n=1 Tax=Rhizobacter sp. J219 TaxID=2898430 RepID=UPI00215101DE|nr:hypothetical protein [Rhizobacter sp. J219]MCR5885393.1 hypothetical protein [Rhizobacter sp. J219]